MKLYTILLILFALNKSAFSQVYLLLDQQSPILLTDVSVADNPIASSSLLTAINKHVTEVQEAESLRLVDSVGLNLAINDEGIVVEVSPAFGYSQTHIDELSKRLKEQKFKKSGRLTLIVVYPPLQVEAYKPSAFQTISEPSGYTVSAETSLEFKVALFNASNSRSIAKYFDPPSDFLTKHEGTVDLEIVVDSVGKIIQATFQPASFSRVLNDRFVTHLSMLQLEHSGTIDGHQTNYLIYYRKTFATKILDEEQAKICAREAKKAYFKKNYHQSIFLFKKLQSTNRKLSNVYADYLASGYLMLGDTNAAVGVWFNQVEDEVREHKYVVPEKDGLHYTGVWKEKHEVPDALVKLQDDRLSARARLPIYKICEDIIGKEEQTACFYQTTLNHIAKNFTFPPEARELGIYGRVMVGVLFGKDGNLSDITIIESVHPLIDNEAMRVISTLPPFIPAKDEDGNPVSVFLSIPINTRLQ